MQAAGIGTPEGYGGMVKAVVVWAVRIDASG